MTDAPTPTDPAPVTAPPRRWDWRPKLRWFAAEIVVVVAGVLIALALNAWWAEQQRADAERALIVELREDVENTRVHTQERIRWHQGMLGGRAPFSTDSRTA